MAALEARVRAAKSGRGGFCLLVGEAGIGKTRCIDELSTVARSLGFAVWSGRAASETLAPVYFPWLSLLRSGAAESTLQTELASLVAQLSAADRDADELSPRDAVLSRLSLFESVTRYLVTSGRHVPLLLALDDLHWADAGTLELLGFVSAELRNARVLVVAASHESSAPRSAELLRHAERFEVGPLAVESVAQYLAAFSERGCSAPELSRALHRASAGNPLFMQEALRELIATHGCAALAGLPAASVKASAHARDMLSGRLLLLPDSGLTALSSASVLGESFEVSALQQLTQEPLPQLLHGLSLAQGSGFIAAVGSHQFHFRHELFREIVYEQVPLASRLQLHRAAARLLEGSADAVQRKSEIAQHHYRALALGDFMQVCEAALDAAHAAERAHSYADAVQFYGWAREALALDKSASRRQYAELLLSTAQAQRRAGYTDDARNTVEQLVNVADRYGFAALLVQAARALRLSHAMGELPDALARRALERAMVLLADRPIEVELQLQAQTLLSWLPPDALDVQRSKDLSARTLLLARASGSNAALVEALIARLYALSGPDDAQALFATSEELLQLDADPRGWISVEAYTARHCMFLQLGDLSGAEAALRAMDVIAQIRGFVELQWNLDRHRAQSRLIGGDIAGAAAELSRLEVVGQRLRVTGAPSVAAAHRLLVGLATHGPSALPTMGAVTHGSGSVARAQPHADLLATFARLALATGEQALAKQVLEELSKDDFRAVPKNLNYLHALCTLGCLAIGLAQREQAELVYAKLTPYAHYNTPNLLCLYEGAVAYFLGSLAAFLGQHDDAAGHFALAIELNERWGLRPLVARSYFACARWATSAPRAHRSRAAHFRARAVEIGDALGLTWLADQARALTTR